MNRLIISNFFAYLYFIHLKDTIKYIKKYFKKLQLLYNLKKYLKKNNIVILFL